MITITLFNADRPGNALESDSFDFVTEHPYAMELAIEIGRTADNVAKVVFKDPFEPTECVRAVPMTDELRSILGHFTPIDDKWNFVGCDYLE